MTVQVSSGSNGKVGTRRSIDQTQRDDDGRDGINLIVTSCHSAVDSVGFIQTLPNTTVIYKIGDSAKIKDDQSATRQIQAYCCDEESRFKFLKL